MLVLVGLDGPDVVVAVSAKGFVHVLEPSVRCSWVEGVEHSTVPDNDDFLDLVRPVDIHGDSGFALDLEGRPPTARKKHFLDSALGNLGEWSWPGISVQSGL